MIFRKCSTSDLNSVCKIHKECFPDSFSTHLTRGKKLLFLYYKEYLETESDLFFVADCDGEVVGFCMGYKRENNKHSATFVKNNRLSIALNIIFGIIRFDKVVWKKIFKKKKKEEFSIINEDFRDDVKIDKGDILSICVLPSFRNRGIASSLLHYFENSLLSIRRKFSQLSVEIGNESAIRFYEKNRYQQFAKSLSSIKMFKELSNH